MQQGDSSLAAQNDSGALLSGSGASLNEGGASLSDGGASLNDGSACAVAPSVKTVAKKYRCVDTPKTLQDLVHFQYLLRSLSRFQRQFYYFYRFQKLKLY